MPETTGWKAVDLQRLLSGIVGIVLVIVILAFFSLAWGGAQQLIEPEVERQLRERVGAVAAVTDATVQSAVRDLEMLVISPLVIDAAVGGATRARQLGLDRVSVDEAERRMAETRSLRIDSEVDRHLAGVVERSLFAELIVTDRNGYVVAGSGMPTDFVQSDEAWWRDAYSGLGHVSGVERDESTGTVSVSISWPVAGAGGAMVGVVKGVLDLGRLRPSLNQLAQGWGYVQVVDDGGRLISDPEEENLLELHPDPAVLTDTAVVRSTSSEGEPIIGMTSRAFDNRWQVVYWVPEEQAFAVLRSVKRAILIGGFVALLTALMGILIAGFWVSRQVGQPVKNVASVADKVGGGDLRVRIVEMGRGEVRKLCIAVQQMIDQLSELVGSLHEASYHTRTRSEEIATAVEQLSAGAEEMTSTLARLTGEASEHSETIQEVNAQMEALGSAARDLAQGAETSTERSRELLGVAQRNRERLREGHAQVEQMAERSDMATTRLLEFVEASRQFGDFVDLIKQFARRTNLLALNAAIEAARAGAEARGFGVLADEIRKLANQAGEAADSAQETTDNVLGEVESTRQALEETRETTRAIGTVVESMERGFDTVTEVMSEAEGWADRVAAISSEVDASVGATAGRLGSVATGFTDFAAAMEELAAGMQEQNASTEEIAAAVTALSSSALELAEVAGVFTVEGRTTPDVEEVHTKPEEKAEPEDVSAAVA
ncbi:MAG: methyl-accepting chemotaxis protein [Gemmatimonadota bacterium]|nr:MAG: methyl-accepting chemotaxis protein [Gemmatimonadota bacterium]